ncbi:MAG TPA: hypothetical protein ENJ53_06350 [Phaeodactylibacter sp.]|nr:hypothetical protein [Phaeodactylibacter sp.]
MNNSLCKIYQYFIPKEGFKYSEIILPSTYKSGKYIMKVKLNGRFSKKIKKGRQKGVAEVINSE